MNLKKAKILRRISKEVFLVEKKKGNENIKEFNPGQVVWMEQTKRKVLSQEQDYVMVQEFDANGNALKNEDGSAKLTPAPAVNEDGTPKMRSVEWAPGTISVHPLCERGIYRTLKKTVGVQPTNVIRQLEATLIMSKLAGQELPQ
jgi:hypothetical protein